MALGAWMLAWGWAAEAHEPSYAGGAPSVVSVSSLPSPSPLLAAQVTAWQSGDGPVLERRDLERRTWHRQRSFWDRENRGWATVRGGFFDTEHVGRNDWMAGFKVTGTVSDFLQIGISTDLQRRSEADRVRIEEFRDPSGNPVRTTVTTFESSSNLIPILGVVELRPAVGPVRPYVGFGAGYEALVVEVRDFVTGIEYQDDFGGFGCQPYAGVGLVVARNAQVVGEVYRNFSTVSRTVRDIGTGALVDQEIDVDGVGFRAGLSIGF
jgi:hypothetical protein